MRGRPKKDRVAERWAYWEPWCALDAKRTSDPQAAMDMLRVRHKSTMLRLLARRISMGAIRRADLDNPRIADDIREQKIREAQERRESRMGRVKGVHRGHKSRSSS